MKKKALRKRAQEIWELEKECQLGKNVQENMEKMYILMSTLSLEELVAIDDYIWTLRKEN